MTGTFGMVCHARNTAGQDLAMKVFTLPTQSPSYFADSIRRCYEEFELLQTIPPNKGLVHGAGQMLTMETTSAAYYLAIPMSLFSHVPFEVHIYYSLYYLFVCVLLHLIVLYTRYW